MSFLSSGEENLCRSYRGREEGSLGLLRTLYSDARLMEGAWGDQSPGARCLLGGECCPVENEGEITVNGMGVSRKESRCGGRWKPGGINLP